MNIRFVFFAFLLWSGIASPVSAEVKISHMGDFALGTWSGSGDKSGDKDVCIFNNDASPVYSVTVSGTGAGTAFYLTDGTDNIPINLYWNDSTGTSGRVPLSRNVALTGQTGADITNDDCGGASNNNANISLVVESSEIAKVSAGSSYSASLTFLIEDGS